MPVAYSRVMFLGTAGVGKTCFNRALRKLPWKSDTSCTIISDVSCIQPPKPRVNLGVVDSGVVSHQWHTHKGDQWTEATDEEEIEELALLMNAVHHDSSASKRFSSTPSFHSEVFVQHKTTVNKIISKAIEYSYRHQLFPQSMNAEFKSLPFFHFWDCGGQPAFLEILPAFLTPRTMFFLLFDASKPLNTNWQSNYHIDGKRFDREVVNMTTLDYMLNWMANIHSHLMSYNEDGGVADYPRMFCIGTHGDLLTEEKKKEVKKELEGHYRKEEYSKLIEDTLIIDNTSSGTENEDIFLLKVREDVLKFTEEKLFKETPLTWVLFRKVLQMLGENVISLHSAYEIGAASKVPQEDVPSVLLFYHDLGAVLFYPQLSGLKDTVIVNPKYFISALGKIFSFDLKKEMPKLENEVELFHQYGILVQPLYTEVWKSCEDLEPNMFIEVLVHFHLAAQVITNKYPQPHKQYFIPAVLSLCDDVSAVLPSASFQAAPLHITFSTGFVPPGFFTRFVAVLASKLQLFLNEEVYRNHVTFRYQDTNSSSIEHMIVTEHHDVIQINVYRAALGSTPLPPQIVYPELLIILKGISCEVEVTLNSSTYRKKKEHPITTELNHVCISCPQSTSPHYIILAPTDHTVKSEVSCKNNVKRYRKLEEEEEVWFISQHKSTFNSQSGTSSEKDTRKAKMTAVDRFTSVCPRLTSAITPCINGVVNGLHANGLIGFELKDELINSQIINARKADKLMIELERSLCSKDNPDEFLKNLCLVLSRQNDLQITQIAESM